MPRRTAITTAHPPTSQVLVENVRTRLRLTLAATTAALAALMVVAPGASGSFGATTTHFAAGDGPMSVAVGNFNGDAYPDLATANFQGGNVSVLLGAAGGSFGAPTNFAAGAGAFSVAIGDFNGDGDPDLAVANFFSNNVSVLLGAAGGGFGAKTDFTVGTTPRSVAVGDFNGDADPDLAVANSESGNVSVLLGGAGGSFGTATNFAAGDGPRSVAVGNFNGDSDPDLAVANVSSNNVSVLLGGAGGGFGAKTDFATGAGPVSVAVGEFNGDADPDLAVANYTETSVSVLLGGAGGSFGVATSFFAGMGPGPRSVAVGDFNGDADPDLAVASYLDFGNQSNVSVLLGGAGGSFGAATRFAAPNNTSGPSSVAVGDFNGDSRLDLVVANEHTDDVSVWRNTTDVPQITDSDPDSPANENNPEFKGAAVAGSTVRLYTTPGCTGPEVAIGPAAAFASPGLTVFVPVPSDSTTIFRATATDGFGNVSPCSAPFTYVEDSTPPAAAPTVSLTIPFSPANYNTPLVMGSGAEANSTVRLYTDPDCDGAVLGTGSAAKFNDRLSGAGGITATVPDDQTTDLFAAATDEAGNASACSSEPGFDYTEDSTAPAPLTITDTDPDSPANDNNPKVKGSGAEAGSTVTLYNNANRSCTNHVGTGSAAEFNSATGITAAVPGDQTSNLRAAATDQAGNTSACSGPDAFPYTEDSTAPAAPTISDTDPDSPANDNNPEVKGAAEAGSTVKLYGDSTCTGAVLGTGTAAAFNGSSGVTAGNLPDDQITNLRATATDQAGNISGCSASFPYTQNSTIPEAPEITDTDPDSPAADPRPLIKGNAPAGSTVTVYVTPRCSGDPLASGSAADFADPGLEVRIEQNTTTDFTATATVAGNTSACSRGFTYVEDSDPPDSQIVTSPPNPSSDNTGDFTFSSTGGGTSFECRVDGAPFGPFSLCSSPHATEALADGSHTFEVRATDAAGNVDQVPASYTWTVDTSPPASPTITATAPTSPANDNNPEVKGTAEAGSTVKLYNDDSVCADPADATGTVAAFTGAGVTVAVVGDHTTQLRARAVDQAGNTSVCSAAFAYVEDSTAPETSITRKPPKKTRKNKATFEFESSEAGFACKLDSKPYGPCSSPKTYKKLKPGRHKFQVQATDPAGNADATPATYAWRVKP